VRTSFLCLCLFKFFESCIREANIIVTVLLHLCISVSSVLIDSLVRTSFLCLCLFEFFESCIREANLIVNVLLHRKYLFFHKLSLIYY
jgi:hypothetical protein